MAEPHAAARRASLMITCLGDLFYPVFVEGGLGG